MNLFSLPVSRYCTKAPGKAHFGTFNLAKCFSHFSSSSVASRRRIKMERDLKRYGEEEEEASRLFYSRSGEKRGKGKEGGIISPRFPSSLFLLDGAN